MTLKTLKYSHVCGRTWDAAQRALEQQAAARAALETRLAQEARDKSQVNSRNKSHEERIREHAAEKRAKYASLLAF